MFLPIRAQELDSSAVVLKNFQIGTSVFLMLDSCTEL